MIPKRIEIVEVGPREGFQFEGIGRPNAISVHNKLSLIDALGRTGVRTIQIVSFVHPKQVPQMADAEQVLEALQPAEGVAYTGIYLNDVGVKRAVAQHNLTLYPDLVLSASAAFATRNQKRTLDEDRLAAEQMAKLYRDLGTPVRSCSIMAAFGCNYEGPIELARVIERISILIEIAAQNGGKIGTVMLADTMGWADPEFVRRTVGAVRERWSDLRLTLHLHDTRGLGIANAYAGLLEGVDRFESAVGGLGGCPFAGQKGAAGNIATEELVFLCERLGIETGIDLGSVIRAGHVAETIVGHELPSKLLRSHLGVQS
jgi:hydroxymethylglutaryl-CoA lyase